MTAKQNKRKQFADQLAKWFGPNSTTRKMHRDNKEVEMRKTYAEFMRMRAMIAAAEGKG